MAFDDFLADGQTHARAGVLLAGMQALENDKNAVEVFRIDPDPVIADRKEPLAITPRRRDLNVWRRPRRKYSPPPSAGS
jgi:hypothetical protein